MSKTEAENRLTWGEIVNQRIDIRMSCSEDAYDIWQLMCEHADYEGHTLVVSGQLQTLQNQTYPAAIWVVEIDGSIVGYMSLIKQFSTWDMNHYP